MVVNKTWRQSRLHQSTVATARNRLGLNTVINRHPPPISDTERWLPRVTRTILLQLRSEWSNTLNSYRKRIIPGTPHSCPSCNQAPYDTAHLSNCPTKPTPLQPIDLWLNPILTADSSDYRLHDSKLTIHTTPTDNIHLYPIPSTSNIQAYNYNR